MKTREPRLLDGVLLGAKNCGARGTLRKALVRTSLSCFTGELRATRCFQTKRTTVFYTIDSTAPTARRVLFRKEYRNEHPTNRTFGRKRQHFNAIQTVCELDMLMFHFGRFPFFLM